MTKIYTKTGDKGKTSLFDGTRVSKFHLRVETYGTIDELNSVLGVVAAQLQNQESTSPAGRQGFKIQEVAEELLVVQKDLLDIGSRLANPKASVEEAFAIYLEQRIIVFEKVIDMETAQLPELMQFILPGGSAAGAFLHVARTIARRAERRIVELAEQETVDGVLIKYLNRLSDLLFTMSRFVNFWEKKKETIWTAFEK